MVKGMGNRLAILIASAIGSSVTATTVTCAQEPFDGARQVTHSQTYDPSFSPNGKRMVFISVIAGREQLFTADLDGAHGRVTAMRSTSRSVGTVLAEPTVRSSPRKQTGQQGLDSLSLARVEWTVLNDW